MDFFSPMDSHKVEEIWDNEEILVFINEYRILKQIISTYDLFKITTHRPCKKTLISMFGRFQSTDLIS